jgi:hypothetical protein
MLDCERHRLRLPSGAFNISFRSLPRSSPIPPAECDMRPSIILPENRTTSTFSLAMAYEQAACMHNRPLANQAQISRQFDFSGDMHIAMVSGFSDEERPRHGPCPASDLLQPVQNKRMTRRCRPVIQFDLAPGVRPRPQPHILTHRATLRWKRISGRNWIRNSNKLLIVTSSLAIRPCLIG